MAGSASRNFLPKMRAAIIRAGLLTLLLSFAAIQAAPPQVDWLFPIGAQRGSEALAQIGGKHNWPLKIWTDDKGIRFAAVEKKKGFFKVTVGKGVLPGPHLVRFYDANGTAPPRVFYVSKAPDVPEKEPNNEMSEAQAVTNLPAVVQGKLGTSGDVDAYQFKLKAGQTLVAQLDAYTAGVSMDALLMLRNARGTKLTFNHDAHSLDPRLVWQCSQDGDYILQVAAFKFPANSTSSFSGGKDHVYRLTLTNGPFVRHTMPGGVEAQTQSSVKLVGWNLTQTTMIVPKQGEGEAVVAIEAVNGPLRLPVSANAELNEQEPNDTNATAHTISLPVVISGQIDKPDDVDRFAFTVKKNDRFVFSVESFRLGFLLDGRLSIEDATGKELASNDDANKKRDPEVSWTAPTDGRYSAVLRSLLRKGGSEHFYRLQIHPPKPSFTATVPAPQFAVNAGTTNEVKVAVKYLDGLTGKLTVQAQALPEGVTVEPEELTKSSTATLKLIASKEAKPFNGPLRLAARVGVIDEWQAIVCPLTSAGVNNGVPQGFPDYVIPETSSLWLTVLPPKLEKVSKKKIVPVKK